MIFNSQIFIFFFIVVCFLFYGLPHKYRKILLLLASYLFYGWWNPTYLLLIFASTFVDFFASKKIEKSNSKHTQKILLFSSIIVNLGILFSFKYLNFFAETFHLTNEGGKILDVILPVGISFYTFQTLSYTIDVYNKKISAENNLINFALFVSFFPQLVAGPIERAENILPQLKKHVKFDADRNTKAIFLILLGFFQKVVIADNLSVFADTVFNNPASYSGINTLIGTLFFAFQIYADFAGYTNIARGVALFFGVELMLNFRQPYFANSIKDFWHRWHISLSSWFKDYVYIPLGGSRGNIYKWAMIIFATFTLSGLWHGANWTYILWGVFNALLFVSEGTIRKVIKKHHFTFRRNKILNILKIAITFTFILFLWIIFRANSASDIPLIYKQLLKPNFHIVFDHKWLLVNFSLIFSMVFIDFLTIKQEFQNWLFERNKITKFLFIYFFLLTIILIGNWHQTPFIYFQF